MSEKTEEGQFPPPPPYETVQHVQPPYPTNQQNYAPGYTYPSGYTNVPTNPTGGPGVTVITQPGAHYPQYPINTGQVVVTQQPQQFEVEDSTVKGVSEPPSFLCLSIFTVCCCNFFCLGCVALVFSCMARSYIADNNVESARINGKRALIFNVISIVLSILSVPVFYLIRLNSDTFHF